MFPGTPFTWYSKYSIKKSILSKKCAIFFKYYITTLTKDIQIQDTYKYISEKGCD